MSQLQYSFKICDSEEVSTHVQRPSLILAASLSKIIRIHSSLSIPLHYNLINSSTTSTIRIYYNNYIQTL